MSFTTLLISALAPSVPCSSPKKSVSSFSSKSSKELTCKLTFFISDTFPSTTGGDSITINSAVSVSSVVGEKSTDSSPPPENSAAMTALGCLALSFNPLSVPTVASKSEAGILIESTLVTEEASSEPSLHSIVCGDGVIFSLLLSSNAILSDLAVALSFLLGPLRSLSSEVNVFLTTVESGVETIDTGLTTFSLFRTVWMLLRMELFASLYPDLIETSSISPPILSMTACTRSTFWTGI